MEIRQRKQTVKEAREAESLKAEIARQNALIELLAMLGGVDLSEDEEMGGSAE